MELMAGGIGELVAVAVLVVYGFGEGEGDREGGRPVRLLGLVHGLLVLGAVEIVSNATVPADAQVRLVVKGINVLVLPLVVFAAFRAFPQHLGRAALSVGSPILHGALLGAMALVSHGQSPATLLDPATWTGQATGIGLPHLFAATWAYGALALQQRDLDGGIRGFWAVLVGALAIQTAAAWWQLFDGLGGGWAQAAWGVESLLAAGHLAWLTRAELPGRRVPE